MYHNLHFIKKMFFSDLVHIFYIYVVRLPVRLSKSKNSVEYLVSFIKQKPDYQLRNQSSFERINNINSLNLIELVVLHIMN